MTKKADRRKPCANCPFRKEAKLAHWHPGEYMMLQRIEATEGDFMTSKPFGCHKDAHEPPKDRELCVGWLLHQRENGTPSIALRLILVNNPNVVEQYQESELDGDAYDTIDELVKINLERDRLLNPQRYEDDEDDAADCA